MYSTHVKKIKYRTCIVLFDFRFGVGVIQPQMNIFMVSLRYLQADELHFRFW